MKRRLPRQSARSAAGPLWLIALLVTVAAFALTSNEVEAAPGDLDPSFARGGTLTTSFAGNAGAAAVARQPDGRLVVAGSVGEVGPTSVALARYRTNGSLDRSFGSNGRVISSHEPAPGQEPGWRTASDLIVQPDGKLVVAGSETGKEMAVIRFNSDGSLDRTFGDNAVASTNRGGGGNAQSLIRQPDGKLVVAGTEFSGRVGGNLIVVRYNADGSPDASFGLNGRVSTAFGPEEVIAGDLIRQPDGKLVAVGSYGEPRFRPGAVVLVRYEADGSLDPTFGAGGKVLTREHGRAFAAALQPDGKVVVGGHTDIEPETFMLARYRAEGSLDRSFGSRGRVTSRFSNPNFPNSDDSLVSDLAIQADGAIVAAGAASLATRFVLARYRSDGSPDRTFGFGGRLSTEFSSEVRDEATASAALLQPNRRLVAVGSFRTSRLNAPNPLKFAVARYYTNAIGSLGRLRRRQQLRAVLASGLPVPLSCSERCRATLVLRLPSRTARRLRLAATIGRADVRLTRAGRRRVDLRLSPRAGRRLRSLRAVDAVLVARFVGAAAGPDRVSRPLELHR